MSILEYYVTGYFPSKYNFSVKLEEGNDTLKEFKRKAVEIIYLFNPLFDTSKIYFTFGNNKITGDSTSLRDDAGIEPEDTIDEPISAVVVVDLSKTLKKARKIDGCADHAEVSIQAFRHAHKAEYNENTFPKYGDLGNLKDIFEKYQQFYHFPNTNSYTLEEYFRKIAFYWMASPDAIEAYFRFPKGFDEIIDDFIYRNGISNREQAKYHFRRMYIRNKSKVSLKTKEEFRDFLNKTHQQKAD